MNNTLARRLESIGNMGNGQMVAAMIAAVLFAWGLPAQAQPIEPTHADVVYATVDGQPLHLDLYLPDGAECPTPLVIWIHGGGWQTGDKYPPTVSTQSLLDRGFAVASINYRLTSDPDFPNRTFPAQIHDVKGAVRFLRTHAGACNLDPDCFGAWGASAGGHLSMLLGTSGGLAELEGDVGGNLEFSSLVQAATSFCGCSDLWTLYPEDDAPDSAVSQLIGHALDDIKANVDNPNPPYPELVARMDAAGPITHVSSDDPPFFLAHGDEDDVVPPAQSADLAAALEAVGVSVSYHPVPGVGHGGPLPNDLAVEFFVAMLGDGVEPIHVNIVMHNEEPPGYVDFVNDESAFWLHRAALVEFADMLHDNGVMFNWQSDWNFLMAAGMYDTGTPETNGKNIARYLKEDLGFEVDPHAHETTYNYADVAFLIQTLGVIPSQTNGGFIAAPPEDSKLEYLWEPITGWVYDDYTWQANILWGGATLHHIDEESLWASGIWKPKDNEHFMEHDEAAPLPHVGKYGNTWATLGQLLAMQQNGELETGKIHTTTIFVGQTNPLAPGFIQDFEEQIQTHEATGNIRWVGLAEVIDIWHSEYDSVPNILLYLDQPDGNLLANAGFENGGGGQPDGWTTFPPVGPTYTWDNTYSHSGDYSVKVEVPGPGIGMWLQVVDVAPGIVYTLTGQVSFENIVQPGHCNLRVVFRNAGNQIIEFVDLADHDGSRPFELDFPYAMKFRAPDDAVTAEINCFLQGPGAAWFDDLFFGVAPAGSIAGVVTSGGQPLPDARVWISSDPWNKVYEAYTNEFGQYLLEDVPVAFPRYILLAEKAGYRTKPTGDVDVPENGTVTVDFDLVVGSDPLDDLRVKYGFLEQVDFAVPAQVPIDAVIPSDPSEYPASVQPYLVSDAYITSDDPEIVALAQQILDSLAPADRNDTHKVAWAAYEWIAKNINHDGVFTNDTRDVTSGIYQTIQGGWCWSRSFYDWCYKPAETMAVKCAICVEHSWLASAVLRALNIPARARVGAAQFWVQKPGEYGYWVGLSTSGGSNAYREHGILGSGFGDSPFPTFFSVTSEPFLAEDWNAQNKGLWHESHPWGENYPATPEGLAQAHADMDEFEATGEAPHGSGSPPGSDHYEVHYSDITVNLYNMGSQRLLDTRFPIVSESETHHDMERQAWWTNHPECFTRTWIEEITNPPVEGVQCWYHIEFDVTSLLSLADSDGDGDVDLTDFAEFIACMTGPDGGPIPPDCGVFDFDGDDDVDLADFAGFQQDFTGSG